MWRASLLVLLMFAAVFGGPAVIQLPREIGRWKLAQAIRLREAGEKEAASARLEEAAGWFPKSWELRLTRAEWYMEDGKREDGLFEADEMLRVAGETAQNLMIHSQFLQSHGEFERAVEDWKKLERISVRNGQLQNDNALNGLAYAQALANIELPQALENVNTALEKEPDSAAYLDTRGYTYYQMAQAASGDEAKELLTKALADMDPAVKTFDQLMAKQQPAIPVVETAATKRAREARPKTLVEIARNNELKTISAVMHYHRALVLEGLNRKKEAAAERAVVKRLIGREPDGTLF